jgi:hypothetical protein
MGLSTPPSMPSANRAEDWAGIAKATLGPPSNPRRPAPRNERGSKKVDYPPEGGDPWKIVKSIVREEKLCVHCHSKKAFHWEKGCPALGAFGLVVKKDQAAADKLMALWTEETGQRRKKPADKDKKPAARRAQSGERNPPPIVDRPPITPPTVPKPPPVPPPTTPSQIANRYTHIR